MRNGAKQENSFMVGNDIIMNQISHCLKSILRNFVSGFQMHIFLSNEEKASLENIWKDEVLLRINQYKYK